MVSDSYDRDFISTSAVQRRGHWYGEDSEGVPAQSVRYPEEKGAWWAAPAGPGAIWQVFASPFFSPTPAPPPPPHDSGRRRLEHFVHARYSTLLILRGSIRLLACPVENEGIAAGKRRAGTSDRLAAHTPGERHGRGLDHRRVSTHRPLLALDAPAGESPPGGEGTVARGLGPRPTASRRLRAGQRTMRPMSASAQPAPRYSTQDSPPVHWLGYAHDPERAVGIGGIDVPASTSTSLAVAKLRRRRLPLAPWRSARSRDARSGPLVSHSAAYGHWSVPANCRTSSWCWSGGW